MQRKAYPTLNKPYAVFFVGLGACSGIFLLYLAIYKTNDILALILFAVVSIICTVGSIVLVYRASQLEITESGISYGKKSLEWSAIVNAEMRGLTIHLYGKDTRYIVTPYVYREPETLIQYIWSAINDAT